ncbi:unnamed protein product, partial [Allacma fusca]
MKMSEGESQLPIYLALLTIAVLLSVALEVMWGLFGILG